MMGRRVVGERDDSIALNEIKAPASQCCEQKRGNCVMALTINPRDVDRETSFAFESGCCISFLEPKELRAGGHRVSVLLLEAPHRPVDALVTCLCREV